MTAIIGLVDRKSGKVYIGGDSAASDEYSIYVQKESKVFRVGEFVLATSGSIRAAQILRYRLIEHLTPMGDVEVAEYMGTVFVDAVRQVLKEHGYSLVKDNREEFEGADFLVGYAGLLFGFMEDFHFHQYANGLDACGAGREYALGAMAALYKLPPRERILKSLKVASQFCWSVKPPFKILST